MSSIPGAPPASPDYADVDSVDPETGATVLQFNKEAHTGQLRIAERFVRRYAHKLMFVHGIGWHWWTGTHWALDMDGKVYRRAVDLLKELRHEAVDLDPKRRDALLADVKKCESSGGINGVLELAKHMRPLTCSAEAINSAGHLFNASNGTLNLETGQLQPHRPQNLITKVAGCRVTPDAHSDVFERFLETSLPDRDVREYLQRVLGVAMLGVVREHTLPIATGSGGNGKSVLVDAALASFGDYGIVVDPRLIMRTKTERHGTFLADLHGARLVVTSETNEGEVLAASTVKRLTGGDKIRANRMRQDSFEFTPSHTLLYVTNHKPQVNADDKAMWRRLSVVPFDVTPEDPDVKLPEKLRAELPAVLAWIYQGWLEYQAQGLNPPAAVLERTESYRSDNDPLGQFLDDECVTGNPMVKVKAKALFEAWSVYALKQGHQSMTQTEFGRRMTERGFEKKRGHGGSYQYLGVALAADEEQEAGML